MPTYYEQHVQEVVRWSWREAFIKLYEEVLDGHMMDAADLGRVYLRAKGYTIWGERVLTPESKLRDIKSVIQDETEEFTKKRILDIIEGRSSY